MSIKFNPASIASKLQRGQGMTEYIIIVALVSVAAIVSYQFFGQTVREQVAGIAAEVSGNSSTAAMADAGAKAALAKTDADKVRTLNSYNSK